MSAGSDLKDAAESYADDIAAADDIAIEYLGATDDTKPSTIIHGLANIDVSRLKNQASAIGEFPEDFQPIRKDAGDFTELMDRWDGNSADAFGDRWKKLSKYVGYGSTKKDATICGRFLAHQEKMNDLISAITSAQRACTDLIVEHLSGMSGLREDLEQAGMIAGGAAGGAATGAALGSVVPGLGTGAGAIVGGLAGTVGGFMMALSDEAESIDAQITGINNINALTDELKFSSSGIDELTYDSGSYDDNLRGDDWEKA